MENFAVVQLILFTLIAEGAVVFLNPRGPGIKIIYIPPEGYLAKTVQCVTNASANITWVYGDGTQLPPTQYGITTLSEHISAMNVSFQWLNSGLPAKVLTQKIHCQAGSAISQKFELKQGALTSPISGNPSDVTVIEGQDALFTCSFDVANVVPLPSNVTWRFVSQTKNDPTGLKETFVNVNSIIRTSSLAYTSVRRFQAGTYQCVIRNEFGAITSSQATLTVLYFGGITGPEIIYVLNGEDATLNFAISAVPAANEARLSRSDGASFSLLNSTVIGLPTVKGIQHIEHNFTANSSWNGNVSVYARNPFGNGTLTLAIVVLDRPGQINVSIRAIRTGCSNVGLAIQWTVSGNGNSQITSYTLKWKLVNDSMWNTSTLTVSSHTNLMPQGGNHTLEKLKSVSLFDVQVEAANRLVSTPSPVKSKTTLRVVGTLPDKPIVKVQQQLTTDIFIQWTVTHNGGHNISKYTVMWSKDANFMKENTYATILSVSGDGNLTQHAGMRKLENLTAGALYYLMVKAENCAGSSSSELQSFCTRCDPHAHVQSVSDTITVSPGRDSFSLLVKPSEVRCGTMTKYAILDDDVSNENLTLTWYYSGGYEDLTFNISNLEEGRQYYVQVFQNATIDNSCVWTSPPFITFNISVGQNRTEISVAAGTEEKLWIIGPSIAGVVTVTAVASGIALRARTKRGKKQDKRQDNRNSDGGEAGQSETGAGTEETGLNNKPETYGGSTKKQTNNSTGASNKDKPESGGDNTKTGTKGQTNNTEASNKGKPESGEDTTKTGTKKQEPTYMQPEFLKEEERPPQRFPMRPVVYSKLDPKATHELQKWKQEMECELATKQDSKQENNVPGMSLSDDDFEELPDVSTSLV